jgi:hypothetical protein
MLLALPIASSFTLSFLLPIFDEEYKVKFLIKQFSPTSYHVILLESKYRLDTVYGGVRFLTFPV